MRTIGDVNKIVVHVKSVPDASPNADGEWVTVELHERRLSPRTDWSYISSLLPKGQHAVSVRR